MKQITLAIPFYNTSQYFLDCIKYSLEDDFVSEIVVNDDCSSEEHYTNLLEIITSLNEEKIKLFKNATNLGAFRNKYQTVSNCTNDWVYLLDSDNYPFEDTYGTIKGIKDIDENICYSPTHLYCKKENQEEYENISDYNFGYEFIGVEESKFLLNSNRQWFDWFINSGNYIVNKNTYLKFLEQPYLDLNTGFLEADTAATFYFWLKNGGKFKVVEGLRHNHRLRIDSNWHTCGMEQSYNSVNFYQRMILEL